MAAIEMRIVIWSLIFITALSSDVAVSVDIGNDDNDAEGDFSIEEAGNELYYDTSSEDEWDFIKKKDKKPKVTISEDAIFLPHEKYCQYFYVFDGRGSYIFRCASGYRFDAEKLQCLKTKKVHCGKRKKNTESSEEKRIGINFKCHKWKGFHAHEHYCHLFYNCETKKASLVMCPPGMLYNHKQEKCDYRQNVKCEKKVNPYDDEDSGNVPQPDKDEIVYLCPESAGFFPHPLFCNKFIRCWYGYGDVYVCPRETLYDIDLMKCRPKNSVYCHDRMDPYGYEDDEPAELLEVRANFECKSLKGRFPHEIDCNKFYQCVNGEASLWACPLSKLFDAKRQSCKNAAEVTCRRDPVEEDIDEGFICPLREGIFKDKENCGAYYQCKNGKAHHMACPEDELFDTDWKSCADADEVTCGERLLPGDDSDEEDTIIDKNPNYKCEKPHGRFTHEEICNWFYHCKDRKASLRTCKKGKYYDTRRNNCYDEVECGHRRPEEITVTPKPRDFVCPSKSGKYADQKNCGAFFICEKGKHKLHHCPKGKLFHEKLRSCEKEEAVACGNRKHPDDQEFITTTEVPSTTPFEFYCPTGEGKFAHERDCGKFYFCKKWKYVVHKCPKHKLFDAKRHSCEDDHTVTCGERIHPDLDPDQPQDKVIDIESTFQCKSRHGQFAHEEYCHWYYHCHDKKASLRECHPGKYFDAKKRKCFNANEVSCDGRRKPEGEITTPQEPDGTTTPPEFQCPKPEGKFPHEKHCGKFYDCKKGRHKVHECPKRKLFSEKHKKCDEEERVSCGNRIHPDDNPDEPEDKVVEPNPDFRCKKSHDRHAHRNCDRYYHCRDKKATVRECQRGKLYDIRRNLCRDAKTVDCEDRIKPEVSTTTSTSVVSDLTASDRLSTAISDENTSHHPFSEVSDVTATQRPSVVVSDASASWRPSVVASDATASWRPSVVASDATASWRPSVGPSDTTASWRPSIVTSDVTASWRPSVVSSDATASWRPSIVASDATASWRPSVVDSDATASWRPSVVASDATASWRPSVVVSDATASLRPSFVISDATASQRPSTLIFDETTSHQHSTTKSDVTASQHSSITVPHTRATRYPSSVVTGFTPSQRPSTVISDVTATYRPSSIVSDAVGSHRPSSTVSRVTATRLFSTDAIVSQRPTSLISDATVSLRPFTMTSDARETQYPSTYVFGTTTESDPDHPDDDSHKVIDPNPDYRCQEKHGDFPHEKYCKWYYHCRDNQPQIRECPNDKYFDVVRDKCLDWWLVICNERTVSVGEF